MAAATVTAPYLLASSATAVARPTSHQPAGRRLNQQKYLGVFEPDEELSYKQVEAFGVAVGRQPDIVLAYADWNQPFPASFARTLLEHGAEPLIQLEPTGARMSAVAAGHCDGYLRSYARQVRAFGHPVILSFAPEANGNWYNWGWTHTSPATWIAAWRHVVTVMRQQGATNITWLWTLNIKFPGSGPIRDYWPGAAYVNWVGIDGYYVRPHATFGSVFERTLPSGRSLACRCCYRRPASARSRARPGSYLACSPPSRAIICSAWFGSTWRSIGVVTIRTGDSKATPLQWLPSGALWRA